MLSPRLAHRYAKSILSLAEERNSLDEVVKDMRLLQETLAGSKDLRIMLKSPIIPSDKKEKVLHIIFSKSLSEITYRFISLLVNKSREKHIVEMVDSFMNLYNKNNHIIKATLTLTEKGTKSVEISTEVDPSIIGGFVLKHGDLLLDNSVERKLHLIKEQIQDNSYIPKI
jgi:F-type H+-transporting ATPase subunit delta